MEHRCRLRICPCDVGYYFRRSAVSINDFLHLGSLIVGTTANRMAFWAAKASDILEKVKRARMALA
jgi:hypothetical protein